MLMITTSRPLFRVVFLLCNIRHAGAFQSANKVAKSLSFVSMKSRFRCADMKASVLEDITTSSTHNTTEHHPIALPPILQNILNERREFEMNLGKAMDTLRQDYPDMLRKAPDFSIYHEEISVVDPSGVQLSGLGNYKHSFRFLQTIVRFLYNTDRSVVQNRMVYDFARQSIRIAWNAVLVPKVVGNRLNSLYIDGISMYKMDSKSGKIVEHKVEKMVINNAPVRPPHGVLSSLREHLLAPTSHRVPVGVGLGIMMDAMH